MNQTDIGLRLAKMEEVEKIKELRSHRFERAGYPELDVEAAVQLFAEDGELHYINLGGAKGHDEIRAFFQTDPVMGRFHVMTCAYVHVNDDLKTGVGRWHMLETCKTTNLKTGKMDAVWAECSYDDDYIKVDGLWKFQRYECELRMLCSYDDGWAENPVNLSGFFTDWKKTIPRS